MAAATPRPRALAAGHGLFADLRQPPDLQAFRKVRGLAELTRDDCLRLARQEGFAGRLVAAGDFFEWRRAIDFQPASPLADAGSLRFEDGVLVERGRDVDYLEHWHRDAPAGSAPAVAVALKDPSSGVDAVLLRVAGAFMFARGRASPPVGHATLEACVAGTSLERGRQLIDCEISIGVASSRGLRICASTLPHRVDDRLTAGLAGHVCDIPDRAADGAPYMRRWDILEVEGDMGALV